MAPPGLVAIPVVFGAIAVTVITASIYYSRTRATPLRKAMAALVPIHLTPPKDDVDPASPDYENRIRDDVRSDTQHKVQTRFAEESVTTDRGEQVWLVYEARADGGRRYALLSGGFRWELVPASGMNVAKEMTLQASMTSRTVDEERIACALTPCDSIKSTGVRVSMVCLVGWTAQTPQEITAASDSTLVKFGNGTSVPESRAHKYVRHLATQIIDATNRAQDWDWLHACTISKRQFQAKDRPYTPPACVAATWLRRMTTRWTLLSVEQQAVISRNAAVVERHVLEKEEGYVVNIMNSDSRTSDIKHHGASSRTNRKHAGGDMEMGVTARSDSDDGPSDWCAATGTSNSGDGSGGGSSSSGGGGDSGGGSSGGGGGGGGD